jgi:hypothetical protein
MSNELEMTEEERASYWQGAYERMAARNIELSSGGQAWSDVLAERKRQVELEGWTPEHDDEHDKGEIAAAAFTAVKSPHDINNLVWPWSLEWWRPSDRRRNLVKAAALILAEIERLDRIKSGESLP